MLPATPLVHLETVAALQGQSMERLYQAVDAGELLWCFNLAVRPDGLRDLRLWSAELMDPTVRQLPLDQALARIIGTSRARLRGTELTLLLGISRPHVLKLCRSHTGTVAAIVFPDSLSATLQDATRTEVGPCAVPLHGAGLLFF